MLRLVMAATTDAITIAERWRTAKLPRITSIANKHSCDRGVEAGSDPGSGPGRHQAPDLIGPEMKETRDHGSDGRPDLHDRTFPATGATTTEGEGGRHDLGRDHSSPNATIAHAEGRDHVRYSIALDLRGEALCDPPRNQEPQRDRDQDPPPLAADQVLERVEAFGDTVDHQDQGCRPDPDPYPDQSGEGQEASGIAIGEDINGRELAPATGQGPHVGTLKTCHRAL